MTLKAPEFKKALLLGLVFAALPLFIFPRSFGWSGAANGGMSIFLVEILYYIIVYHFLFARESVSNRLRAAGSAYAFRFFLGFVWAVLATGFFDLTFGQALTAGIYGYLPGALLHIAIVPFVLSPVFRFRELRRPRSTATSQSFEPVEPRRAQIQAEPHAWTGGDQTPNFDAAVAHVASYSTVEMAMLVDEEGLAVAQAGRGTADSDLWAPVINLLYDSLIRDLSRTSDSNARRFQVTLTHQRLVVERVAPFYLAVLFDHNTDELVNVRIAQAVEMVKRYYEQKYRKVAQTATTEVAYV
jgi:predicted regulator of Ras-like GTPase activity (Roadblock/LC7/MglB family)